MKLALPSSVLRSPRTPAARRPLSPSAYTSHLAVTAAAQTGLSCPALLLVRVLRPVPRRDPRCASDLAPWMLPSPWHERLGSRFVPLSRLQASLHVAARVLAPRCAAPAASRTFDAPLGRGGPPPTPGACYPAHLTVDYPEHLSRGLVLVKWWLLALPPLAALILK